MRFFLTFFILISFLFSEELSSIALEKLKAKGEKIVKIFCDKSKLPKNNSDINKTIETLKSTKVCGDISKDKLKAVAVYLQNDKNSKAKFFKVPNGAKCPVCGMFVYKYPKWAAHMVVNGKDFYFDGVKDMLKYYFFDKDFKYDRNKISKVEVRDYYTLESLNATKAFYVIGSKIYGPMGNELIPFKTQKEAENFINDHGGRVIKFDQTTPQMVMELDK